ncbi:Uu.00g108390.m01.CDS01 [Anthostomella pinea]|uniref:Uu.00g108390.m01.CDS01 n=1 Tax=Anthostomella pinea TaxID=933095 RepID=A0AAI8VEK7_9PEZI|nr:Uu.00g108390.m01.CDS01 [Anthostomella pinea]
MLLALTHDKQSCLSSAWGSNPSGTITASSWWPAQSDYCGDADAGNSVGSCIEGACAKTTTACSSYTSLSSSLCSRYASCTKAGSTGVQTVTYAGGPVTWGAPGGWGNGKGYSGGGNWGHGSENGNHGIGGPPAGGNWGGANGSDAGSYWSEWASAYSGSKTWTGGVVTVTGCAFAGSPWFVGPDCGWNGQGGFNGWVGWGSGWSWGPTATQTVTYTTTNDHGAKITGTGMATVALAVSGDTTTSTTLGTMAASTGGSDESAAAPRMMGAPGAEGSVVTVLMGVALGAVVAVAGML